MNARIHLQILSSLTLVLANASAAATTLDDIGFTDLQAELGMSIPNGTGVPVSHVEADANPSETDIEYAPNPALDAFAGKFIIDVSGLSTGFSGHANGVGQIFYGNDWMAPGIINIDAYFADVWLEADFLNAGQSASEPFPQPHTSSSRLANHSWIGSLDPLDADVLRRIDWVVDRDEYINVVGFTGTTPLLASAFNVISVDTTNSPNSVGTGGVDSVYTAGRTRPDLVGPAIFTSTAVPMVASAAALLVQTGNGNPTLSTDPIVMSKTNRNGSLIYNAERSEVIKAALMAGADRLTNNTIADDITDYRESVANQASNGLDIRYGAGQLNVFHSYWIVAAGEQNSMEDAPAEGGAIINEGFDYDPYFGGLNGTNDEGTYFFSTAANPTKLIASLVWNLSVDGGVVDDFDGTAVLYDLNLLLYDASDPGNWVLLGRSESTTDNTENIYIDLDVGTDYALQVRPAAGQDAFQWDYALAWRIAPSNVDSDGDGIPDSVDNCINVQNTDQRDTNGDGFGNICDADLNNDVVVNFADLAIMKSVFFAADPDADLTGDGVVNFGDLSILKSQFFGSPGPSGTNP